MKPVVIKVSVNECRPTKGLVTSICGHKLDVSVLGGSAKRLTEEGEIRPDTDTILFFHSDRYGDSPAISGVIRTASRSAKSTRLTIEVLDWDKLASFWQEALTRN